MELQLMILAKDGYGVSFECPSADAAFLCTVVSPSGDSGVKPGLTLGLALRAAVLDLPDGEEIFKSMAERAAALKKTAVVAA